jgi:hypothetical protein
MAAEYSCDHLFINIMRNENFVTKNYRKAIYEGFVMTDEKFRERWENIFPGCKICVELKRINREPQQRLL